MDNRRKGTGILLAILMILCCGCGRRVEPMPEDTIEAYEDAINNMDIQAMLDCIDEDVVKAAEKSMDLMLQIGGKMAGIDLEITVEDILTLMPLFEGMAEFYGEDNFGISQVDFQVMETYIKGQKATVYFTELNSGEVGGVNMEKKNGRWQMTLDTKPIEKEEADRVIIAGEDENVGAVRKRG